jgi:hypothetical protein
MAIWIERRIPRAHGRFSFANLAVRAFGWCEMRFCVTPAAGQVIKFEGLDIGEALEADKVSSEPVTFVRKPKD